MDGHAKRCLAAGGALLVLTTGTLLVSFVMHGPWDFAVAFAFAIAKGSVVVWVFMQLSDEPAASRIAFATGLVLLLLVVTLVVGDVDLRLPLSVQVPLSR